MTNLHTIENLLEVIITEENMQLLQADNENMFFIEHVTCTKNVSFVMVIQENRLKYINNNVLFTRPQIIEQYRELQISLFGKVWLKLLSSNCNDITTLKMYDAIHSFNKRREEGHNYPALITVNEYHDLVNVNSRIKLTNGYYTLNGAMYDNNDKELTIEDEVTIKFI